MTVARKPTLVEIAAAVVEPVDSVHTAAADVVVVVEIVARAEIRRIPERLLVAVAVHKTSLPYSAAVVAVVAIAATPEKRMNL